MAPSEPAAAHARLRDTFETGLTRSPAFRLRALRSLRAALSESEPAALGALASDLRKSRVEALFEISAVYSELAWFIARLEQLVVPVVERTDVGETRAVEYVPRGVVLQIAAFNFPLQVALRPLVGAIAAGNCVVVKPSELAPATERYLKALVEGALDARAYAVVCGGRDVGEALMECRWDHVMYTGGGAVGRTVAEAAARQGAPCLLELGGKSPAVVCAGADVAAAAGSVAFARWMNAGQVCLAVDYCLVEEAVYAEFVAALLGKVESFFGRRPRESPSLSRIVNARHYERVVRMLRGTAGRVLVGGEVDAVERYVAPTVVELTLEQAEADTLMAEEVFGPLLPVVRVRSVAEGTRFIRARDKPLALYVFATDESVVRSVVDRTASGGVAVNYALSHGVHRKGWLGGVGASGHGAYGFRKSFETFSHARPVFTVAPWRARGMEALLYQPAWTRADGVTPAVTVERLLRLYLHMPFPGSGGVPVAERATALLVPAVAAAAAVAAGWLAVRWKAVYLQYLALLQLLVLAAAPLHALGAAQWALARGAASYLLRAAREWRAAPPPAPY
jgi:aldehyde dehydrogenase (NAD+)